MVVHRGHRVHWSINPSTFYAILPYILVFREPPIKIGFFSKLQKSEPFKCQSHKMVKHTQTIRRQLGVFDYFVMLVLKRLKSFILNPILSFKSN